MVAERTNRIREALEKMRSEGPPDSVTGEQLEEIKVIFLTEQLAMVLIQMFDNMSESDFEYFSENKEHKESMKAIHSGMKWFLRQ